MTFAFAKSKSLVNGTKWLATKLPGRPLSRILNAASLQNASYRSLSPTGLAVPIANRPRYQPISMSALPGAAQRLPSTFAYDLGRQRVNSALGAVISPNLVSPRRTDSVGDSLRLSPNPRSLLPAQTSFGPNHGSRSTAAPSAALGVRVAANAGILAKMSGISKAAASMALPTSRSATTMPTAPFVPRAAVASMIRPVSVLPDYAAVRNNVAARADGPSQPWRTSDQRTNAPPAMQFSGPETETPENGSVRSNEFSQSIPESRADNDSYTVSETDRTEIHIDSHALGEWVLAHIEQALTRPPTTANFVMSHGLPTWPGQSPFV